jgi:hypothetical protein
MNEPLRHGRPHARPDAVSDDKLYLIKNLPNMRLTYQIRLLTFLAAERHERLIVIIPKSCRPSRDLQGFVKKNAAAITIKRDV